MKVLAEKYGNGGRKWQIATAKDIGHHNDRTHLSDQPSSDTSHHFFFFFAVGTFPVSKTTLRVAELTQLTDTDISFITN